MHWHIQSRTSRARRAAFGPVPARGVEDFGRWSMHSAPQLVRGFWQPAGAGAEQWHLDAFLWALPGQALRARVEPWARTLWRAWSQVGSRPATFGKASAETFEQVWPTPLTWPDVRALPALKTPEIFEDSAWPRLRL